MPNFLGVDLGGTKVDYILANSDGDFLFQKSYPSPYLKTSKKLPDGKSEVYLDTILTDIPIKKRVFDYLAQTEAEFLAEVKNEIGNNSFEGKGYSLCGRTWIHDGQIIMIGGNTPLRFASDLGKEKIGIIVADSSDNTVAANDGNAAATAQGIYYKAIKGIDPIETGYFILGTGFGFGVPQYFALTEIGHIPIGLIPKLLWQECGCTDGHRTACAENYASGRGIQNTAEILLSFNGSSDLKKLSRSITGGENLFDLVAVSKMKDLQKIDSKTVMDLAKEKTDGLATWIADLAAVVTATAAVTAAQQFGLQIIGIGETIAQSNPWHVDNITRKVDSYVKGSTLLRPSFKVELTPLSDPAKYGALALVVPESRYEAWAEKMKVA